MASKKSTAAGSTECANSRVVSLCARRKEITTSSCRARVLTCLEALHRRAIEIHNQVIDRAEVSVLTELCRTAGLCFDLIDPALRAAVITPAALYGDSNEFIFGKKSLQVQISASLTDPALRSLFQSLHAAPLMLWDYRTNLQECTDLVWPLAGEDSYKPREVAGVIVRCGQVSRDPGIYSGWLVRFEGMDFIAFGFRLDRLREVVIRNLLDARDDRHHPEIWQRLELSILHALVDPDCNPRRSPVPGHSTVAIRQPATRRGLLLTIRRALWRHFTEPCSGLTIHAHLAALIDDPEAIAAFLDEVNEIATTVTIKSGGLRSQEPPLELDEILAPFFVTNNGRGLRRGELLCHRAEVLLLEEEIFNDTGLTPEAAIGDLLAWSQQHCDHLAAGHIENAWLTYRTEQNLLATYGLTPDLPPVDPTQSLAFARRSVVLPNLRTLFDSRFMTLPLSALKLSETHRETLRRALAKAGFDFESFSLDEIGKDERALMRFESVSHHTCNAVREALLELGLHWRAPSV